MKYPTCTVRIRLRNYWIRKKFDLRKICWSPKCNFQSLMIQNKKEIWFKKVSLGNQNLSKIEFLLYYVTLKHSRVMGKSLFALLFRVTFLLTKTFFKNHEFLESTSIEVFEISHGTKTQPFTPKDLLIFSCILYPLQQ